MTKNISILGCGWLGLPLAKLLISKGWAVKGSTTRKERLDCLRQEGVEPYLIHCNPEITGNNIKGFLESDVLFLNIPFKRNLGNPYLYKDQVDSVIKHVDGAVLKKILFAGTTSIYPESMIKASEDAVFKPDNIRSQVLMDIEKSLLNDKNFSAVVLRFSGLYGGTRKIGGFLSGKKVERSNSPVNLVHLEDCCNIVGEIIDKKLYGEIFNICSDIHPYRMDLYTKAAEIMGVPTPEFNNPGRVPGKIVCNKKIKSVLNYTFMYPDPSDL